MANWTTKDIPDLSGKTAVVTGANVGLGLDSAVHLAAHGARVLIACRNPAKGAGALEKVSRAASGPSPVLVALDLADLASVERAAADIAGHTDHIDVLMNNAGVMALPKRQLTKDGFEMQFGVNHLGHFALTLRLMPQLLKAPQARVVALGSMAHLRGHIELDDLQSAKRYSAWPAYNQSKLANVMFALELDRRSKLAGLPVIGVAAHPGLAKTNLFHAGPQSSGFNPVNTVMALGIKLIGQSAEMGALGQLRAAADPEVGGGEYFGPTTLRGARGYPVVSPVSRRALDDQRSAALWTASEDLVGLTFADAIATRAQ